MVISPETAVGKGAISQVLADRDTTKPRRGVEKSREKNNVSLILFSGPFQLFCELDKRWEPVKLSGQVETSLRHAEQRLFSCLCSNVI